MSGTPATPAAPGHAAPAETIKNGMFDGLLGAAEKMTRLFAYLDEQIEKGTIAGSVNYTRAHAFFTDRKWLWTWMPQIVAALIVNGIIWEFAASFTYSFKVFVWLHTAALAPAFLYFAVIYLVQSVAFKVLSGLTETADAALHANLFNTNRDLRDWIQPYFYGPMMFILTLFVCRVVIYTTLGLVLAIPWAVLVARALNKSNAHKEHAAAMMAATKGEKEADHA